MSPTVNEELEAQTYLVGYLESDTTLSSLVNGVTFRSAWDEMLTPYVKVTRLDASDLNVIGPFRIWADLTFLIKGVVHWDGRGRPDWSEAQAIADRIDQLVHRHEDIMPTLEIHSFREESFSDETFESGKLYLHAGGIYRLRAHAL